MTAQAASDVAGRTIVVTGGTSGLGRHVALELARRGATVAAVGRNEARGQSVVEAASDSPGAVRFHSADLAEQAAVRELGAELLAEYDAIHALANNAGIARAKREESPDGIELTLAVNHLAPYLLTKLLLPRLRESGGGGAGGGDDAGGSDDGGAGRARVVATTSGLHYRADLNPANLQFTTDYDTLDAYAQSKLANVAFTLELAERLEETAEGTPTVVANCVHPGFIRGTRIWTGTSLQARLLTWLASLVPGTGTDVETGGNRLLELLAAAEYGRRNGKYIHEGEIREPSDEARDPAIRRQLWERSAELVGVESDWPTA
jgi:NAD(P)-dependent dehydrogenase (short-subunit alcohol dehydrogenase family)